MLKYIKLLFRDNEKLFLSPGRTQENN